MNSLVLVGDGLSIRLYESAAWSVVEVEGDLDMASLPLRRRILAASGPRVVFDLRRVAFMDASGLGLLGASHDASARAGGSVRVSGATAHVRKLLAITHMDQGISIFSTLGEALAAPAATGAPT
ncbi:anti-anti-sigma factor [Nocardioides ginsengisegetis]|uniref:Anti-anti-sigma factor n=1 Tax=Nocardioides ginsengisegetis TaxID=661491 RepID=A0A7W3J344_9ACTN|nr:STAS domain-containing protein [Nocardioides ginsengisegetis]MBA8805428.1 anti-anti-sigma factor [Nocardioides ginsengisegetis]